MGIVRVIRVSGSGRDEVLGSRVSVGAVLLALSVFGWGAPLLAAPLPEPEPWVWQPVTAFGAGPAHSLQTFTIGDAAYLVSGVSEGSAPHHEVWRYDSLADSWQRMSDYPGTPINKGIGFSIGAKGYVGLGSGGKAVGAIPEVWQYDPASDAWARRADFPGAARLGCVAVACEGKAYVFGGLSDGHLSELWEYDPAGDAWTRRADCPGGGRFLPAGFAIARKAYFATGGTGTDAGPLARDVWEYDPAIDAWTRKTDFPGRARAYAVGLAAGGRGYLAFGVADLDNPRPLSDVWEYDPVTDTWTDRGRFGGVGRMMATGFALGSDIYFGLGADSPVHSLADVWRTRPCAERPSPRSDCPPTPTGETPPLQGSDQLDVFGP